MKFQVTDRCVGCGLCEGACHGRCISHGADGKRFIDQSRCLECGSCMTVCPITAILEDGDTYEHPAHDTIVINADIVVLGSGGAGLVAAARAADLTDKKIVILEKMPFVGGGMNFASDWRIYGSKWQEERGIPNLMQQKMQQAMDATNWQLDSSLVYQAYVNTGKFFDWFTTLTDAEYEEGMYIFDQPHGGQILPFIKGQRGVGLYASKVLQKHCREKGVQILTRHTATDFEMTDGRISAVIAKDPGGVTKVNCKAVIMSTGSWIHNKELIKKYAPDYNKIYVQPDAHTSVAYTGDGVFLGEQAGADVDYSTLCLRLMGPMSHAPGDAASSFAHSPAALYVNKNGKRWINENTMIRTDNTFGAAQMLVKQPEGLNFSIFEYNMAKKVAEKTGKNPIIVNADEHGPVYIPDNWEEQLKVLLEPDGAMKVMMMGGPGGPGGIPGGDAPGGMPGGSIGEARNMPDAPGGMPGGMPGMPGGEGPDGMPGMMPNGFGDMGFYAAETLEELCEKSGINYEGLKETIENYNKMCADGLDSEFFKNSDELIPFGDGPFYAVRGNLSTDGGFGGLQIDKDTRAYSNKKDGSVVEGLYVPGDLSASRFLNYNGVKVQVINDLAWAISSGFSAANHAVEFISK